MDETQGSVQVVRVVGRVVTKGYQFVAILADGRQEVVRTLATRPYKYATQFARPVATGKRGLAAFFAYSESSRSTRLCSPLQVFVIDWAPEELAKIAARDAELAAMNARYQAMTPAEREAEWRAEAAAKLAKRGSETPRGTLEQEKRIRERMIAEGDYEGANPDKARGAS